MWKIPTSPAPFARPAIALCLAILAVVGCQEASDDAPFMDEKPTSPPFVVSAPELTAAVHPHGWNRLDCVSCHATHLLRGHEAFPPDRCVRCHGFNGTKSPTCGDCHGVPNPEGFPSSGLHAFHVREKKYDCAECHANQIHRNGGIDIALRRGGRFHRLNASDLPTANAPGCSEVGCHEARGWNPDACESCHASPPENPLHRTHLAAPDNLTCRDCHNGNQHDADIRSGTIEIGGTRWTSWDRFTGDCATACHAETKRWDCVSCHGYPPETGRHATHAEKYQIECLVCHADHDHSFQAAVSPKDAAATVRIAFLFQRGAWDRAANTCVDVGCHPDRTWR